MGKRNYLNALYENKGGREKGRRKKRKKERKREKGIEGRKEIRQSLHRLKHIMCRLKKKKKQKTFPAAKSLLNNLGFLAKNKDPAAIITYCS